MHLKVLAVTSGLQTLQSLPRCLPQPAGFQPGQSRGRTSVAAGCLVSLQPRKPSPDHKTKRLGSLSFLTQENLICIPPCRKLHLWPSRTTFALFCWFYFSPQKRPTLFQFLSANTWKSLSTPSPTKLVNTFMLLNLSIHPHIKRCEPQQDKSCPNLILCLRRWL